MYWPSADMALKAIFCPSGETTAASGCASLKERLAGGSNESRIALSLAEERVREARQRAAAISAKAPATIQGRRTRHADFFVSATAALAALVRMLPDELDGADNASSAKPRSCAEWKRCSGLFSRQRRISLSSAGGAFEPL